MRRTVHVRRRGGKDRVSVEDRQFRRETGSMPVDRRIARLTMVAFERIKFTRPLSGRASERSERSERAKRAHREDGRGSSTFLHRARSRSSTLLHPGAQRRGVEARLHFIRERSDAASMFSDKPSSDISTSLHQTFTFLSFFCLPQRRWDAKASQSCRPIGRDVPAATRQPADDRADDRDDRARRPERP
jgi:hypothetical protein